MTDEVPLAALQRVTRLTRQAPFQVGPSGPDQPKGTVTGHPWASPHGLRSTSASSV